MTTSDLDDRLAQAIVDVADGLDLATTLDRILRAAVELTGARYGALGVLGDGDRLAQFLYRGLDPDVARGIGELPVGRGVLGELIRHPEPLRLAHLSEHPAATGFPPGHPAMDSFLGVPIRAGESVFGNLYLTEKPGGFTEQDSERVQSLAVAAGVAVRNAQLFEAAQLGGQWQAAAAEMANAALRGEDGGTVLELLARNARQVAGAQAAIVVSPVDGEMLVEVVDSAAPLPADEADGIVAALRDQRGRAGDPIEACLDGQHSAVHRDLTLLLDDELRSGVALGCFPVMTDTSSVGTLLLLWPEGQVPGQDRLAAVHGMAVQAAVSLSLDVARLSEHKLLIFRDRDRIARDLHDLVVQRLFASGVSLQVLARRGDLPAEAQERVEQLVGEMDATIASIRDTIFELREGFSGTWQLTELLQDEVDRMAEPLGFEPLLQVDADLTTLDADDVAPDAVAVVREALANIARHAGATRAAVRVWFADGTLGVEVSDDGHGPGDSDRESGLGNLADRAMARGGSCALTAAEDGGSLLRWSVPLHGAM